MLPTPTTLRALPGYRLWLRYDDGVEGEVDLSGLAGRGVFERWNEPGAFERVRIEDRAISWGEDLDICPDSLYLRITGTTLEELATRAQPSHA